MALPSLVCAVEGARRAVLIPLFLLVLLEFLFSPSSPQLRTLKVAFAARARAAQPSFGLQQLSGPDLEFFCRYQQSGYQKAVSPWGTKVSPVTQHLCEVSCSCTGRSGTPSTAQSPQPLGAAGDVSLQFLKSWSNIGLAS